MSRKHEEFMSIAIEEAQKALEAGERPIGAVVARDGEVVARAYSIVSTSGDPTAHSEVTAIRNAAAALNSPDLKGCTLYTSCEPCPMCVGAMLFANIDTLVIGASSEVLLRVLRSAPRSYSVEGLVEMMNHKLEVVHGVLHDQSAKLLEQYSPPA